jgi:hypothetical protein
VDCNWLIPGVSCLDAVIHRKNLHFGQSIVRNRGCALQPFFRPEVGSVVSQQRGLMLDPVAWQSSKLDKSVTKSDFFVHV